MSDLAGSADGGDLDLPIDALRRRQNRKWTRYGSDVIPAWIADMDFRAAPSVQAVLARLTEEQDYGYADRDGDSADRAIPPVFARYQRERYGWDPDPELVQPVSDLIQAMLATVLAYTEPQAGVLMQMPAYPPFRLAVESAGRKLVANPMHDDGHRWTLDMPGLEALAPRAGMMVLCNPHNPTGRVLERDELMALGRMAVEHDLVLVSDEVHSDLVYPGRRHMPVAMVSPEVAARTVTITSATKSFNIAGLRCAVMHFGSSALFDRFNRQFPNTLLGQLSVFGVDATVAAWTEGQSWLQAVVGRLDANRAHLREYLANQLPTVRYREPEATYFAWLDVSALNLRPSPFEFLLQKARVATSAGSEFGPEYSGFVRLNFATSPAILGEILSRVGAAVRSER